MVYFDQAFYKRHKSTVDNFKGLGGTFASSYCDKANLVSETTTFLPTSRGLYHNFKNGLYDKNNCGCLAVSFAIALGFKEIFLFGMDCQFSADKKDTHFHKHYNNEGKREQSMSHFVKGFHEIGVSVKKTMPDITLYNCQPTSPISIIDPEETYGFKKLTFKEFFNE